MQWNVWRQWIVEYLRDRNFTDRNYVTLLPTTQRFIFISPREICSFPLAVESGSLSCLDGQGRDSRWTLLIVGNPVPVYLSRVERQRNGKQSKPATAWDVILASGAKIILFLACTLEMRLPAPAGSLYRMAAIVKGCCTGSDRWAGWLRRCRHCGGYIWHRTSNQDSDMERITRRLNLSWQWIAWSFLVARSCPSIDAAR